MKNYSKKLSTILLAGIGALSISCESGILAPKGNINDDSAKQGSLTFSMTDAPIDGSNVSAAFVTVTEIKVDGQTFSGFKGPKTVNVLALQNGNSLNLGNGNVAAGTYSKMELILDIENDASKAGPGCYVLKTDGTKDKLEFGGKSQAAITLKPKYFKVDENGSTEIIMDFDLRKSIKSSGYDFSFVTNNEMEAAIRAENRSRTGAIKGKIDNYTTSQGNVLIYAYKKGTFNANSETKGSGSSNVTFAKAVTSSKVNADGTFSLSFLEEGNYELHCQKTQSNGSIIGLNALLELKSSVDLSNVGVNAGVQTSVALNFKLDGLLNL